MSSNTRPGTHTGLRAVIVCVALSAALGACGGGGGTTNPTSTGGTTSSNGAGGTTSPSDTPVPRSSAKLFFETAWRTNSAQVAVDAQGGRHAAYAFYEAGIDGRPSSAVYRYCAADCSAPGAWTEVRLASSVRSVQLKLTPQGKPRLLIAAASQRYVGGTDYHFAACDEGCAQVGAWSITLVFSGRVPASNLDNDDELPQRSFALDPQGRPRFVVFDENQLATPEHFGLYYMSCNERCDQAVQWSETLITVATRYEVERVAQPALAFSREGRPRVASAQFYPLGSRPAVLMYLACEESCDRTASWGRAELMPRGSGAEPSVDIAVGPQGQPRMAFYQEALLEGDGKRLFYLSCETSCLDPSRWQGVDLGLGSFNGQEPDLELDGLGRPRIAFVDWEHGGIGYAWCDQACAESSTHWNHRLVETRDSLQAAWPVAFPAHCTGGLWNTLIPSLSFAPNGTPTIAFDATYHARCLYDHNPSDNVPATAEMNLVTRSVRVVAAE